MTTTAHRPPAAAPARTRPAGPGAAGAAVPRPYGWSGATSAPTSMEEAAVVAEVAALAAAVTRMAALVGAAGVWSAAVRRGVLQGLDGVVDGLAVARAAVLVAERESGAWQGAGDRSFEAWRGRTSRVGARSAVAQVRQAEQLAAVPEVSQAVAEGRIGLEHAVVIGKLVSTGTPAQQQAATCPDGQEQLLGLAKELDAGTFATTVARWAATVDPDGLEADHQAQRRERFLQVADTPRGTFIKGRLDRVAGHRFTLALEALTGRPAADDDRDAGQRRADALDTMAGKILASVDTKPGGHVPPQVSLIMSEQTWAGARAHRDRQRAAAAGAHRGGSVAGGHRSGPVAGAHGNEPVAGAQGIEGEAGIRDWPGRTGGAYPPATLEDGTPVPPSELAVVMCECAVTRIVVDADGVPVNLGRTQRLFTGEQRRAVIARDRECIWPECHMPARWCEVHHLAWWERDNGVTSTDNGALLCAFHHHESHRRDLTITRIVTSPTSGRAPAGGSPPGRSRRGSAIALVAYEFRDRTGRLVGVPPGDGRVAHADTAARRPAPTHDRSRTANGREAAEDRSGVRGGLGEGGAGVSTELPDLEWTTDPMTGMRVPTFFLSG